MGIHEINIVNLGISDAMIWLRLGIDLDSEGLVSE